ncbi:MAG: 7-cyano-7-deazaguanine synthase QueC [Armatimonadetes bacterium]|nr:7-cyano-7-deazaguanine synthase QueC [Armatimonadota bacterium]MDE2207785.1 7-cyano-7-deazaguanine synthase QueC [Armatimonadota bacterium]
MDSCVTAAIAKTESDAVAMLHVSYGQRTARRELKAFRDIASHYAIPDSHRLECSLEHLTQIGGSSLTDHNIPVAPADLESTAIPASYVPFRNAHLLSIAVSWAEVLGATRVYIGAVFEDSSGYPDCRPAYFDAFNRVIEAGTAAGRIRVVTPIIHLSKQQIVELGVRLGAPLALSWSCYQREDAACGECDSCALRLRGFARAGLEDPLPYAVRADWAD